VFRSKGELEAMSGLLREPGFSLLGDVRGMIIQDQLDRCVVRIGGVEKFEKLDEFPAAVAIFDQGVDLAGNEVDASQQADSAVALIFVLACEGRVRAGLGALIGPVVAKARIPGFSS
jgi:hypothetical protein